MCRASCSSGPHSCTVCSQEGRHPREKPPLRLCFHTDRSNPAVLTFLIKSTDLTQDVSICIKVPRILVNSKEAGFQGLGSLIGRHWQGHPVRNKPVGLNSEKFCSGTLCTYMFQGGSNVEAGVGKRTHCKQPKVNTCKFPTYNSVEIIMPQRPLPPKKPLPF